MEEICYFARCSGSVSYTAEAGSLEKDFMKEVQILKCVRSTLVSFSNKVICFAFRSLHLKRPRLGVDRRPQRILVSITEGLGIVGGELEASKGFW